DADEDGIADGSPCHLGRGTGSGGVLQTVAENIDALNFVYLDEASPPAPLALVSGSIPAGDLSKIRSVEITIVARTGRSLSPSPNNMVYYNQQGETILGAQNDNFSRKRLTTFINCRNLRLN
ncbi:MAG: prepilin-type cleavage/methylation domain-containing protein, partial [Deltaproteobacteria bacterium]|nr:prepilin-type cleavage/methylation domain-containing protein [Deltaproteobacteria bacterium]